MANVYNMFPVIGLLLAVVGLALSAAPYSTDFYELNTNQQDESVKLKANINYRLPTSVVPKKYTIHYTNVSSTEFSGNVNIEAEVNEDNAIEIGLHRGSKMSLDFLAVYYRKTGQSIPLESSYNNVTEIETMKLKKALGKGDEIVIKIKFFGNLRDDMTGFYRSTYIGEDKKEKWLATTQFEATSARHAFPCFDEPAYKAKFTVLINKDGWPTGYDCLSNMPQIKNTDGVCKFSESVPMSTYLVAFVISDLKENKSESAGRTEVKVWTRKELLEQASYAGKVALSTIKMFEKKLDVNYALEKMDLVAVPDFAAGAMENWGLLTFREANLLHDEDHTSNVYKQRIASVVVHEIAHMWFGNLVTPKWWSYLWLSEGFARYYQYMGTAEVEDKWRMEEQFVVEQHQTALAVDALEDSKPMTRKAESQAEIGGMGDTITYNKGASVLRMIEKTIGTEVFNLALRDYMKQMQMNNAEPGDLWKALQNQADKAQLTINIAEFMTEWTEQPGFPVITATIDKSEVSLKQERFLLRNLNGTETKTVWRVPITWMSSTNKNSQIFWLTKNSDKFKHTGIDENGWFILNVNSIGFYRVNYDEAAWRRIIKALNSEEYTKIPVFNRAAILDDLLNLARAGLIGYDLAFEALQYLKRETDYLPFKTAFTGLDHLIKKFSALQTPSATLFKDHMLSLISNIYEQLLKDDESKDDHVKALLRQEIYNRACGFDHPKCVDRAVTAFAEWIKSNKPIPKNQRSAYYCAAMKQGGEEYWKFLWEKYEKSTLATEQLTILNALACHVRLSNIYDYLLRALDTDYTKSLIRKQDISSVFTAVYSFSPRAAENMIDFINVYHKEIKNYYKSYDEVGNIISGLLQKYPTKRFIGLVEDLMSQSHFKPILPSLQKSVKLANVEITKFNQDSSKIINWVKKATDNTVDYRLPANVIPQSYAINLIPRFGNKFDFDGKVIIKANVTRATKEIVLHSDQIKIKEITVTAADNKNLTDTIFREEKYHFTKIMLSREIKESTIISISITYTGLLNTEMRGFYRSSYEVDGKKKWLAATHLEPVGARRVFPCFDEPALKATFDITVDAPKDYHVISNTKALKQGSAESNVWIFETTPIMSTYLVAIVVSDFVSKNNTDNDLTCTVWSSKPVSHQLDYSLSVMNPVVRDFEKRLGHKYPQLNKLEMIALPDFSSGAMENWGLITYRESNMLYESWMTSLATKQAIRNVIAHEIAHQWFGNLVSPLWWDYLWLNEGFARYFQYFAHTSDEDSWNLEEQFVVDQLQTSFSTDALSSTHPITHPVFSPAEIKGLFDTISYAKAGSVIRMMEKWMGSTKFYKSLTDYLSVNSLSVGDPNKLFSAFDKNGFSASEYFRSWTVQSGFPVITVSIKDNTVDITQKRFYLKPKSDDDKASSQIWLVPLTYTTGDNPNFDNTIPTKVMTKEWEHLEVVNASKTWVIFNLKQSGYYRVNYDESTWDRIFKVLDSDNYTLVNEINRAAIVDDLLNLARAGELSYDVALKGLRYLHRETEYAPWKAAYTGFSYLQQRIAARPVIFSAYRNYIFELLEPVFQRLGFDDKKTDRHTDQLLRKLVLEWMCSLQEEKCVNKAVQLLSDQMANMSSVTANQQTFVYCTAIRHGGYEEYKYLFEKFQKSIYSTEKLTILAGLGCSQDSDKLYELLNSVVQPESSIRLQDAQKVFTNVIDGGSIGVSTTLEFIEKSYKKMSEYFGDNSVTKSIISTVAKRLSSSELNEKFKKFIEFALESMPDIEKSLKISLKTANYESNWYTERSLKFLRLFDELPEAAHQSSYRLPKDLEPISYNIYLTPYFDSFKFDGKVIIKIKVTEDTHRITLNKDQINLNKIELLNNQVAVESSNVTTQQHTIYFTNELKANTEIVLTIEYTGVLRNDMRGFYRSSYVNKDGTTKWIASTQFEPTYARSAFPCFDEPSFKAVFTINIAPPMGYNTILSNMGSKPDTTKPHETIKDRVWHTFKESKYMSSYLVAFVVSDFESVMEPGSRVAVWSRLELNKYCNYASKTGHAALGFLENLLKKEYVLDEMNFVSVPDFDMGAMENWGLVTYREYGLSYDLSTISATYRRYVNTVISHELVHMWFGNLVTLEWWDYTWLNEGFAEYISYIVSNASEPSWELLKQFVVNEMHVAFDADAVESSHPMNNKVLKPTDIQDAFDKIAYQKAASVLRMFHNAFGNDIFVKSLQSYISLNQFSNTHPDQLMAEFEKSGAGAYTSTESYVNVTTVMKSWVTQAGYPVVTAVRSGNEIRMTQERFLVSSTNATAKNVVYYTPITLTTQAENDFNNVKPLQWLGKDEIIERVNLGEDSWYMLNIQQVGFYRVNYDKNNWLALISQLNGDEYYLIHELNRAQLIDDSLNLARAGYIDYDIALNITKYLSRETSYYSWRAFFNSVAYLSQRIDGDPTIQQLYRKYVLSRLPVAFDKLGFLERNEDTHLDQLTRELVLTYACKYGHEDCIKSSKDKFLEESITPNIAGAVYCTAIENGTPEDWKKLYDKYTKALLASDYITMLKGLGCSKDVTVLQDYLSQAFDSNSKIRRQDLATVLSSVYTSSEIGLETAINYFLNNASKIHDYYGNWDSVGSLFTSLAGRISKKSQIDILQKSLDENNLPKIKSYLESAIKTAEKNLQWFEEHSSSIKNWLENYDKLKDDGNAAPATVTIQICMVLITLFTYFSFY